MDESIDASSPPFGAGGEAATLIEFLGYKREAVMMKARDLPQDAVHRAGVPSGTSLAWLLKHLTASERLWFGGATFDEWDAASQLDADEAVEDLIADYQRRTLSWRLPRGRRQRRRCADAGRGGRIPLRLRQRATGLLHINRTSSSRSGHRLGPVLQRAMHSRP